MRPVTTGNGGSPLSLLVNPHHVVCPLLLLPSPAQLERRLISTGHLRRRPRILGPVYQGTPRPDNKYRGTTNKSTSDKFKSTTRTDPLSLSLSVSLGPVSGSPRYLWVLIVVVLLLPMGLLIIAINKINLCGKMINSQGVAVIGRRFAAHPKGGEGEESRRNQHTITSRRIPQPEGDKWAPSTWHHGLGRSSINHPEGRQGNRSLWLMVCWC